MTLILPRRKFLVGLAAGLIAAPAIVRAGSLMAIRPERRLTQEQIDLLVRPPLVLPPQENVMLRCTAAPGAITYHVYHVYRE